MGGGVNVDPHWIHWVTVIKQTLNYRNNIVIVSFILSGPDMSLLYIFKKPNAKITAMSHHFLPGSLKTFYQYF